MFRILLITYIFSLSIISCAQPAYKYPQSINSEYLSKSSLNIMKNVNFSGTYKVNIKNQNLPGIGDTDLNMSMPFKFVQDGIIMSVKTDAMALANEIAIEGYTSEEIIVPPMTMTFLATETSGAIFEMKSEGLLEEKYYINQAVYKRLKNMYNSTVENALQQIAPDTNSKSSISDIYTSTLVKNLIFELEDFKNNHATYSSEMSTQLLGPLIKAVALFTDKRLNQIFNQEKDERISIAIRSYRNLDQKLFESILEKFTSLFKINLEMKIKMTEEGHILPISITTSDIYPSYEAFRAMISETWSLYHQAYPEDSPGLHALYLGLDKDVVKRAYDYLVSIKFNLDYELKNLTFLNTTSKELDFQKPDEANDISQEITVYMPMIEQLLNNPSILSEGGMTYDLF